MILCLHRLMFSLLCVCVYTGAQERRSAGGQECRSAGVQELLVYIYIYIHNTYIYIYHVIFVYIILYSSPLYYILVYSIRFYFVLYHILFFSRLRGERGGEHGVKREITNEIGTPTQVEPQITSFEMQDLLKFVRNTSLLNVWGWGWGRGFLFHRWRK